MLSFTRSFIVTVRSETENIGRVLCPIALESDNWKLHAINSVLTFLVSSGFVLYRKCLNYFYDVLVMEINKYKFVEVL